MTVQSVFSNMKRRHSIQHLHITMFPFHPILTCFFYLDTMFTSASTTTSICVDFYRPYAINVTQSWRE